MAFLSNKDPQSCLVEGCPGQVATRTAMLVRSLYWYVIFTLVILEERNLPHPQCIRCDMMLTQRAMNGRHPDTAQCARGGEQKRRWLVE